MSGELGFGRTCGWAHVPWLFNTGMYTLLFLNKEKLYMMSGMGLI
jgi:hypothetical protein